MASTWTWTSTDPQHAGYVVGYVSAGLQERELGARDHRDRSPMLVSGGCACGWRSPRWIPTASTIWRANTTSVEASASDAELAIEMWRRHLVDPSFGPESAWP